MRFKIIYNSKFILLFTMCILLSFNVVHADEAATGTSEKTNIEVNKTDSKFPSEIEKECGSLISNSVKGLKSTCQKNFPTYGQACNAKYNGAAGICNPDTNSELMSKTLMIQGLLGTVQGSINDSCSVFSKAMSLGKAAMSAYTTYCSTVQKLCDSACGEAVTKIQEVESAIAPTEAAVNECVAVGPEGNPDYANCLKDQATLKTISALIKKELTTSPPTIAAKSKVCKIDMMSLMGMGLVNIAALAQSKALSDQCDKESKANSATATTAATDTTVDCALAANADKPICICKANPRLKGCEGVSTSLATNSTMSTGGSGSTSGKGLSGGVNNGTDSAINKQFPSDLAKTNKNDGTSSGSGYGGSSAGLSPSSDGTVGNADAQLGKNSTGNANILSGDSSGGGGGYRFGLGSGSSAARNLARNVAGTTGAKGKLSAMDWTNQVTSNAGKSNFDKIKVRYIENRTSLLNK